MKAKKPGRSRKAGRQAGGDTPIDRISSAKLFRLEIIAFVYARKPRLLYTFKAENYRLLQATNIFFFGHKETSSRLTARPHRQWHYHLSVAVAEGGRG